MTAPTTTDEPKTEFGVLAEEEAQDQELQKQVAENLYGAADSQDAIGAEDTQRVEQAAQQAQPPTKEDQPPAQPQASPSAPPMPPGVEPRTGPVPGVPYTPFPVPGMAPGQPAPFGQPGAFPQMPPQQPTQQPWQIPPQQWGQQPQQPTPYKPYELPQMSPDVDDNIVTYGQQVSKGFAHFNEHLAQMQNALQQMQAERQAEQFMAIQRAENEAANWFDGQVAALAGTDKAWAQQLGTGAFNQLDVNFRSERQQLKNLWDGWRAQGLDGATAFEYAKNGRYAHIIGQLQSRQAADSANALAEGNAVPPAGGPTKASDKGTGDSFNKVYDELRAKGAIE